MTFCLNFTASAFNTNVFDTAIDKSGFTPMCNNQAIADKDCRVDDYLEGRYVVTSTVNLGAKCAFVIAEVIDSQTNYLVHQLAIVKTALSIPITAYPVLTKKCGWMLTVKENTLTMWRLSFNEKSHIKQPSFRGNYCCRHVGNLLRRTN
ncbi:hypothetical protein AB6G29_24305 [Providencia hangzhouensis]|uniref:hypothetical protein n=1 Tax=Providencia hangzhouensis TaxID=3031799 RepID=UPI00249E13D1|nr:hypothetical protein [Providencia rettgeri]